MLLSAILCTTIRPSTLCSPLLSSTPLSSATPTVTSPDFCFPLIYAIAVCAPASRCTPAVWRYQPETFPMHFTRMDLPSVCISRKYKTHGSTFCLLTDPGQALWWCMWLHMLLCGCNPHCRFTAMLSNQSIAPRSDFLAERMGRRSPRAQIVLPTGLRMAVLRVHYTHSYSSFDLGVWH